MANLACCLRQRGMSENEGETDLLWQGTTTRYVDVFEKARYLEKYRSRKRSEIAEEEARRSNRPDQGQMSGATSDLSGKSVWRDEPWGRKKINKTVVKSPLSDGNPKTDSNKVIECSRGSSEIFLHFNGSRDQYTCLTTSTNSVFGCKRVEKDSNSNSLHLSGEKTYNEKRALTPLARHLSSCIHSGKSQRQDDGKFSLTNLPESRSKTCICEGLNSVQVVSHEMFPSDVELSFRTRLSQETRPNSQPLGKSDRSTEPNVPAHLQTLYGKQVVWAHHVQRPLNCWLGKFGVPHVGVIVTTEDGEKWLVHKAKTNGTMDTVVSDLKSMKPNWSVKSSKPVAGYTVGDFVKASGSKYNLLTNNCWDSRKRMMELCDND